MFITKIAIIGKKPVILNTTEQDYVENSLNVDQIQFSFSGEIWADLTKVATFILQNEKIYNVPIIENACIIPQEVYSTIGEVSFGVYGYKSNEENVLELILPTTLINFTIEEGAYKKGIVPGTMPSSENWQLYMQQVNNALLEIENKIPTKTSELENDAEFLKEEDLDGYAKQSWVTANFLNSNEVQQLIEAYLAKK